MSKDKHILIVDDEADLVDLVVVRLEHAGYEVTSACDGQEGLEKARALRPDLILLDVMMPKLNGFEVCRILKSDAACQQIPIIMLTAHGLAKDEGAGRAAGANAYITKPFEAEALLKAITQHMG